MILPTWPGRARERERENIIEIEFLSNGERARDIIYDIQFFPSLMSMHHHFLEPSGNMKIHTPESKTRQKAINYDPGDECNDFPFFISQPFLACNF